LTDTFQLRQPGPFRSRAQRVVLVFLGLRLQGLTEQAGLSQHAFAFQAVGLLVILVPGRQLAGGQWIALQGGEQRLRLFAVGARQRGQHPGGGPRGEFTLADGGK
jgi:hypothetical protein